MKIHCGTNAVGSILLFSSMVMLSSSSVSADELSKRRSGLWQSKMTAVGIAVPSVQECIDHDVDNFLEQPDNKVTPDCSVMDIEHRNGKVILHSVCRLGKDTVTTDGEFAGDFSSAYWGKVTTHFGEPIDGVKQGEIIIDSTWLGPCPSGRKVGVAAVAIGPSKVLTVDQNDPEATALLDAMKANVGKVQK